MNSPQLGRDRRTERYRALVLVLAFGGLRFGEATAQYRPDVLPGGRPHLERSVRRVGGRWVVGEPRTHARHRTVTLAATALLYQHAADDRDADIARALDAMLCAITEPSDDRTDEQLE